MLGTLLNRKSQISLTNAKALKEALARGVKVVIATGKVRRDSYPHISNSLSIRALFRGMCFFVLFGTMAFFFLFIFRF